MKSFTPYLKKRNAVDKTGIINIRVTENRTNVYYSLKISVPVRFWNKNKKEVRSSYKDYISINTKIKQKIEEIEQLENSKESKNPVLLNDEKSFLDYFKSHIDSLYRKEEFGNYKRYTTSYKHLLGYIESINKADILFSDIDLKWIKNVDEYIELKGVGKNTRNNYLKCCQKLFREALKEKAYFTYQDPFLDYSFANTKVNKQYLSESNLQNLVAEELERDSKIEEIRNRFLTQVYLCGCRVSDLFTIRFKQIYFDGSSSRINFVQYKSKKDHTIHLGYDLIKHIFFYLDREKFYEAYYEEKYSITITEGDKRVKKKGTLPQIERFSMKLRPYISGTRNPEFDKFIIQIADILGKLNVEHITAIREHSINHPNDFIIPVMNNELFKNVEFNENCKLSKKQYNYMDSKIAVYNKDLKQLQRYTGNSNLNITSHTARHSYANLILSSGGDIYALSKSLGHSNLSVTEAYVSSFNKEVVEDVYADAFRRMRLSKMKSSL